MSRPGELVTVCGKSLHVVDDAAGEPPLLLTSGLGGAWYDWSPLMPRLPSGHRVLRFDRPGLGGSPGDGRLPTLRVETQRLAALVERFAPQGVVVVAHSLAGLHAEALARHHPHLVHGLVLVDVSNGPSATHPRGTSPSRQVPLRSAPADPGARASWALAELADRSGLSARLGPAAFTAALRLLTREPTPDAVLTAGRRAFRSATPMAAAWCELLGYRRAVLDLLTSRDTAFPTVPVHVLTAIGDLGRTSGRRWIERQQRLAVELDARHRIVVDAGHFVAWQRPDAVVAAIDDVVRRVR